MTTNPDDTTREATYSSCGCAGGETVTVRDEAGRERRLIKDNLGRLVRVEEMWGGSVYATTAYQWNGRDQLTRIEQGDRIRTFGYTDGHGRLTSRVTPEQGQTAYAYNQDDTLNRVTDARGASATFAYNGRGLVTNIDYQVAGGAVETGDVGFTYDAAGNRQRMTDGHGSKALASIGLMASASFAS